LNYLNPDKPGNWCTKVGESTYRDKWGILHDLETDNQSSRFSQRVYVKSKVTRNVESNP
jgi:hypothetical protein